MSLGLRDLTGFNGRADAIFFSSGPDFTPPPDTTFEERTAWGIPGVPATQVDAGEFDLVVGGGGYGGLGAARMGVTVGRAAALATIREGTPRDVYEKHLDEVKTLWRLPGNKRSLEELKEFLDGQSASSKPEN